MRNFIEERRQQLIEDELNNIMDRLFPEELRKHYSQSPLLALLLSTRPRGSKSPYTKRIKNADR